MVISFRGRLVNEEKELKCKCSAISQNKVCVCSEEIFHHSHGHQEEPQEIKYTVYDDELVMKVTPEMVRLLMKTTRKDSKYATTSNAQSFMKLFKEEIEDGLREAVKDVIRRHYD